MIIKMNFCRKIAETFSCLCKCCWDVPQDKNDDDIIMMYQFDSKSMSRFHRENSFNSSIPSSPYDS